jgi:hypothetical protein
MVLLRIVLAGGVGFAFAYLTGLPWRFVWAWAAVGAGMAAGAETIHAKARRLSREAAENTLLALRSDIESILGALFLSAAELPAGYEGVRGSFGVDVIEVLRGGLKRLRRLPDDLAAIRHVKGRSVWRVLGAMFLGMAICTFGWAVVAGWKQGRDTIREFTIVSRQVLRVTVPSGPRSGHTMSIRYLLTDEGRRPLLREPPARLEARGADYGTQPRQGVGDTYPEWTWELRAEPGEYRVNLSFEGLRFDGASVRGTEIPPGRSLDRLDRFVRVMTDGASLTVVILTPLGLTLWQQNFAMAVGCTLAALAALSQIVGRGLFTGASQAGS